FTALSRPAGRGEGGEGRVNPGRPPPASMEPPRRPSPQVSLAVTCSPISRAIPPALRRRKFRFYARPALLCIDEVGYLTYDSHAADLLFQVVNYRYERNSILLTTHKGFKDWNTVFPNATSIAALLDLLTHHADVNLIEGTSYRVRESELETAARKKPKCQGKPHAD